MSTHMIRRLQWRWDKASCVLWASVTFSDGTQTAVGLPLAQVTATWDQCAAEVGLAIPPFVGDVDSVDGLFDSIKSAVKSVGKVAKKAVAKTSKALAGAAKTAATVVRSKYTAYALSAVATVFPAVGGPALLAQQAAARAAKAVEIANQAREVVKAGGRTVQAARAIAHGANVQRSVQRLVAQNTPAARMAIAALKSTK